MIRFFVSELTRCKKIVSVFKVRQNRTFCRKVRSKDKEGVMKQRVYFLGCLLAAIGILMGANISHAALNPNPPTSPVKLIFIHHSTGGNWLADVGQHEFAGGLGNALRQNNYFVSATNYGWGPDGIGDRTDIPNWPEWFTGPNRDIYMKALYTESDPNFGDFGSYSRLSPDPGGQNEIIMFKSCFPNSNLDGNPNDPPASEPNDWELSVSNAKAVYNNILTYFATRQDKLFIVITAPPLMQEETSSDRAANARAFNNWLVNDWLQSYSHHNVAVFDFYNVLTSNGGSTTVNDAGQETGNHHRYRNNAVQHIQTLNNNYSSYYTGDSHPSAAGGQKATTEFVPLLNIFYHCWKGTGDCPNGAQPLSVSITADPVAGPPPLDVNFSSTVSGGTAPYVYQWTFGDSTTSDLANPSHTFNTVKDYTVTLEVTDSLGSQAQAQVTISVQSDDMTTFHPGWNLFSLPVSPADGTIGTLLQPLNGSYQSVWSYRNNKWFKYDPTLDNNTLTSLQVGLGYWIKMNQQDSISFTGTTVPHSFDLTAGWNLVGFCGEASATIEEAIASIRPQLEIVWSYKNGQWSMYDPNNPVLNDLDAMNPGDGYYIRVKAGCKWTFPYTNQSERLQPSDFQYLGAFRLPGDGDPPLTFAYGGNAMSFNPDGDPSGSDSYPGSLFIMGHDRVPDTYPNGNQVAEVTIPPPAIAENPEDLPVASFLQNFHDVLAGCFTNMQEIPKVGMQYLNHPDTGPKIHVCWGRHLQSQEEPSHAWFNPTLDSPDVQGFWFIGTQNLYSVNGYMFDIPTDWADAHAQGRYLATGRMRDGGQGGMGPALFAYRPWMSGGAAPATGTHLSETVLLLYENADNTQEIIRSMKGYQHPDEWEGGAWITTPSGKSAVLFAGTKSTGTKYWYGFIHPDGPEYPCVDQHVTDFVTCRMADGSPCPAGDFAGCCEDGVDCISYRGWWSTRFDAQFILYDPADLARVASGEIESWEPQPYASIDIDEHLYLNPPVGDEINIGFGDQRRYRIASAAYDRASGLLYVLEQFADGGKPVVHVWKLN